jgi:hypothetical protein
VPVFSSLLLLLGVDYLVLILEDLLDQLKQIEDLAV